MLPLIQESKDQYKRIHHLWNLPKIRTTTREEKNQTLTDSQKETFHSTQNVFTNERVHYA